MGKLQRLLLAEGNIYYCGMYSAGTRFNIILWLLRCLSTV